MDSLICLTHRPAAVTLVQSVGSGTPLMTYKVQNNTERCEWRHHRTLAFSCDVADAMKKDTGRVPTSVNICWQGKSATLISATELEWKCRLTFNICNVHK